MFKNPFSFEGRIRRTEFGLTYIIYYAAAILISIMINLITDLIGEYGDFLVLSIFPLLWFLIAQGAKRCHDRGNSGWYQLIPLYTFWMLFADSQYGPNEYGVNPKGLGNFDEIDEIGKHLL